MLQSIPLALVPYNPIVALVQQPTRRQQAQAKIAASATPIEIPGVTYLPEGPIAIAVESSNVLLRNIPLAGRNRIVVLVENFIDNLIKYEAGLLSAHAYQKEVAGVNSKAMQLHAALHQQSAEPPRRTNAFCDLVVIEKVKAGNNENAARKLHEMLVNFLDINDRPQGEILQLDGMVYKLKQNQGDYLIIMRRCPNGLDWLSTEKRRITSRQNAQSALVDLEREYQFETGLLGEKPKTGIIKLIYRRTAEELNAAIEENTSLRMSGYKAEAVQRANVSTQQSLYRFGNPFAPSAPSLAGGAS
jgi:hypothetical protein